MSAWAKLSVESSFSSSSASSLKLDVKLKGHRADVRVEVEESRGSAAEPLRHVTRIGERGGQRHDADVPLKLRRNVAHARADNLKDWLKR